MFLCNICVSSFDKNFNFERHLNNIHHIEISVNCKYCGLHMCKNELENHISSLHQDRKFVCGSCRKKFSSKRSLNQHKCEASLMLLPRNDQNTEGTDRFILQRTAGLNKVRINKSVIWITCQMSLSICEQLNFTTYTKRLVNTQIIHRYKYGLL